MERSIIDKMNREYLGFSLGDTCYKIKLHYEYGTCERCNGTTKLTVIHNEEELIINCPFCCMGHTVSSKQYIVEECKIEGIWQEIDYRGDIITISIDSDYEDYFIYGISAQELTKNNVQEYVFADKEQAMAVCERLNNE